MAAILKAISELNVGPFEAAMGRMERRVDRFATGNLAQVGRAVGAAFSVYAIGRFVSSVGQAADQLDNVSKASGVGVENLQALNVLFKEGGKEAGDVSAIMARLKKSMDDATNNPQIAQSFQRLGIAFSDVANKSPDRILELIAKALRNSSGDMQKGEAAGNLLGRSYAELQGIMNTLAAQGLDPLRESLKATNQIMSEESVRAADQMQEAYDKLGRQLKQKGGNAAVAFFGGLQAAWVAMTGGGWQAAADALFGPVDTRNDPLANKRENDAKLRSADAMARMANMKRNAAGDWFNEQVGKIRVGDVKAADQLASIGGYIGGQSNPAAQMAERQLKVLELQKELQDRIAKATESGATATRDVADRLEE